jgi:hypothetical protein
LWFVLGAFLFFLEPFYLLSQKNTILVDPVTEKTNQVGEYHGTKVADPTDGWKMTRVLKPKPGFRKRTK